MKVDLIRSNAKQFLSAVAEGSYSLGKEKHQLVKSYQEHWDLAALDLASMYARCFQSESSGFLWGGSKYSAKESMLTLLAHDPNFVRQMFRDLYNDKNDLTLRVDRFIHHCDAVAKDVAKQSGRWMDAHHTYREASLYLSLQFPLKYTLFDAADAASAFRVLGAKQELQPQQLGKYFTLCQTLYKLVVNEDLITAYRSQLVDFEASTMMVHDFCQFLARMD